MEAEVVTQRFDHLEVILGRRFEGETRIETAGGHIFLAPQAGGGEVDVAKAVAAWNLQAQVEACLLYTSPSPRDLSTSRMPSSA